MPSSFLPMNSVHARDRNLHPFSLKLDARSGVLRVEGPAMTISRSKLLAWLAALLALVAVSATPGLLGHRVASAFDALAGAEKNWLALGAILIVLGIACTVGAWRAALDAAGG